MFHLPVGGAGDDLNADVVPVLNGRARLSHLVQQREATHCQSRLVQRRAAACKKQLLETYGSSKRPLRHSDDCFILMIQTADCGWFVTAAWNRSKNQKQISFLSEGEDLKEKKKKKIIEVIRKMSPDSNCLLTLSRYHYIKSQLWINVYDFDFKM